MKAAIPYWQNRISPVLDTAENFLIVDIRDGRYIKEGTVYLGETPPIERAKTLKAKGVTILICGAVSDYFAAILANNKIEIVPWIRGDIDEILTAAAVDNLGKTEHFMPGCRNRCGNRHRFRGGCNRKRRQR